LGISRDNISRNKKDKAQKGKLSNNSPKGKFSSKIITSSLGGLGLTFLMAKAGVAIGFLTAPVLICKAEGGR